jgi:hypothetical protein
MLETPGGIGCRPKCPWPSFVLRFGGAGAGDSTWRAFPKLVEAIMLERHRGRTALHRAASHRTDRTPRTLKPDSPQVRDSAPHQLCVRRKKNI